MEHIQLHGFTGIAYTLVIITYASLTVYYWWLAYL